MSWAATLSRAGLWEPSSLRAQVAVSWAGSWLSVPAAWSPRTSPAYRQRSATAVTNSELLLFTHSGSFESVIAWGSERVVICGNGEAG